MENNSMDRIRHNLRVHGQEHLLQFWDELNDDQKYSLKQDLLELDLIKIESSYVPLISSINDNKQCMVEENLQPLPRNIISSIDLTSKENLQIYEKLGLKEIANGHVAVLLMAGGQGTRLGVNYVKGMFDVGLPSHKTLFQLQAERILSLQNIAEKKYKKNSTITWYIMSNEATHEMTLEYLKKNDYFGIKNENVVIFKQGMIPCFTFEGNIILDEKYRISKAPDGNGGLYRALKSQGILDDMMKRGIRSIHAHSVDNILIKVADPIFIGYCLSSFTDCGVKVIEKVLPKESIGVVCKVNGKFKVVEYSEITEETAEFRDNDGCLVYNAGNICNHYFSIDFLISIVDKYEDQLELHLAKKKIPYINAEGNRISPTVPNGIKIEKFVFDVFKFSKNFAIWKGRRESEFSPLKNSNSVGVDCPTTARNDMLELHKNWLLKAGAKTVDGPVEISPLLSYAGENLNSIADGQIFQGPCVLESNE